MRKLLLFSTLLLLLPSCGLVQVVGFHSDYGRLTEAQREKVRPWDGSIDSLTYDEDVYVVGVSQVREFVSAHDSVLVYSWSPFCGSEACVSPAMFEEYCRDRNLAPCILLNFFSWERMPAAGTLHCPILFVDPRPYGSRLVSKYMERIEMELTEGRTFKENDYSRYFLFRDGRFAKAVRVLE